LIIILLHLSLFLLAFTAYTQCEWNSSGNNIYYNSGKVAINTSIFPIHPELKLTVKGSQIIYGVGSSLYFAGDNNTAAGIGNYGIEFYDEPNDANGLNFWRPWGSKTNNFILFLKDDGNVGIGTQELTPGYKLTVKGKIHAREVLVTGTAGADFVFDKTYNLPSLSDVETFISNNKHLPDIPSANEMQTNGVNMAEFQIKLLQKVEELTLYIIEQQKEIDELKKNSLK